MLRPSRLMLSVSRCLPGKDDAMASQLVRFNSRPAARVEIRISRCTQAGAAGVRRHRRVPFQHLWAPPNTDGPRNARKLP